MYCEILSAVSKEMKFARTMFSSEQRQRSALLCVRCRNQKKAIQKPVKVFLFTRKDFLGNNRRAGDRENLGRDGCCFLGRATVVFV
jgi:hypothetical protein